MTIFLFNHQVVASWDFMGTSWHEISEGVKVHQFFGGEFSRNTMFSSQFRGRPIKTHGFFHIYWSSDPLIIGSVGMKLQQLLHLKKIPVIFSFLGIFWETRRFGVFWIFPIIFAASGWWKPQVWEVPSQRTNILDKWQPEIQKTHHLRLVVEIPLFYGVSLASLGSFM